MFLVVLLSFDDNFSSDPRNWQKDEQTDEHENRFDRNFRIFFFVVENRELEGHRQTDERLADQKPQNRRNECSWNWAHCIDILKKN